MADLSRVPADELIREIVRRFTASLWADNRQEFERLASEMRPYMEPYMEMECDDEY
jgi:hypothetical protein